MRIFKVLSNIQTTFMETLSFALIAIAFITAGFFVWFFTFKARQEERRFLIEKGYRLEELPSAPSFTFPWRKTGIVIVGAMLGLILNFLTFNSPHAFVPVLLLGAGVGMILAQAFDNGYPARHFLRSLLFAIAGFTAGGLVISLALTVWPVDDAVAIFTPISFVIIALMIERHTRKA